MPTRKKMFTVRWMVLILAGVLSLSPLATEKEKGTGTTLPKAPPKMLGLKNPYANDSEDAGKAGLKLFKRHCASCHEKTPAVANSAPSLGSSAIRTLPAGYLFWYLKNGNLSRGMPSWSGLPDERLWQLVTYLQDVELNRSVASSRIR